VVAKDLELAMELADTARAMAMDRFRADDLAVESKPDGSPVSDADQAIERALRERLAAERPAHAITGEEFGSSGESDWRWYLDPIDGTQSYVEGGEDWKVLIALVYTDRPVVAVVDDPAKSTRWWAVLGEGAFHDGQRMFASAIGTLAEATVSDNWRHDLASGVTDHPLARVAERCRQVRPYRGDTFLALAASELDVAVGLDGFAWDYAPFLLIVEEAGGRFTDFSGRSRFDAREALVSNGALHGEALSVVGGAAR
jgi:histidinol-phosphatase